MAGLDKKTLLALGVVALIIIAGAGYMLTSQKKASQGGPSKKGVALPPGIQWDPVYAFNKEGYEPSLVLDSKGYMYYTAHKNLDDKTSWDYLASWFFVGSPDGKNWVSPSDPFPRGAKWKTELGDEGDLAMDANDRCYYVDTYLVDNHLHVFDSPGVWQYSVRIQKTTGLDDRPWIAAQGDGIGHYLGNNGQQLNGGRYWYYRSTDGGRIWSRAVVIPGNGWGHIDAETKGQYAYVISESDVGTPADINVFVSPDQGATWDFNQPTKIGHRDNAGLADGFPVWISAGTNGSVWALWTDTTDSLNNGSRMFLAWSFDYGTNWQSSDITPWNGLFLYPTIDVGDDGTIAVAAYGTETLPVTDDTPFYLYGAMIRPDNPAHPLMNPSACTGSVCTVPTGNTTASNETGNESANFTLRFNFTKPEETPCTKGTRMRDLHDFFEIAVGPDGYLNIAYQHYVGPANGNSDLFFVRGNLATNGTKTNSTR
jgi:hypothetical protein